MIRSPINKEVYELNYKEQAEQRLRAADFDKYELQDLSGISLPNGDSRAKMRALLRAAGNPYLFRVGDIGVHVSFSGKTGDTLQGRICRLLSGPV